MYQDDWIGLSTLCEQSRPRVCHQPRVNKCFISSIFSSSAPSSAPSLLTLPHTYYVLISLKAFIICLYNDSIGSQLVKTRNCGYFPSSYEVETLQGKNIEIEHDGSASLGLACSIPSMDGWSICKITRVESSDLPDKDYRSDLYGAQKTTRVKKADSTTYLCEQSS